MEVGIMKKWISDKWYVSKYNFNEKVREAINLPEKVIIADCTLRDGEQQAGIVFNRDDKVKIARILDEIRIPQIEAGMPAASKEDEEAVKAIMKENLNAKIYALARAMKSDIDKVIDCETWGVVISLPSGYLQVKYKLRWEEEKVINTALEMIDYAKDHGLWINLSPYDNTRAEIGFLERYIRAVVKSVDRIRLVDTAGCTIPAAIRYLVEKMKDWMGDTPLEIHCHNDFGLGTANTLAALEAGAEAASTTINGIGERVGNTATEEVALALQILYGVDLGLDFGKFYEASHLVQELSGIKKPYKPVVGDAAFRHETGMAVYAIETMPFTTEPYSPEFVGQKRTIVLGKKSGIKNVEFRLKELGLSASEKQMRSAVFRIKEESVKKKRAITDEEFKAILKEVQNE